MKILLYGFLLYGLLFSCSSKKEERTSDTVATPVKEADVIMLKDEKSSSYVDTLTISFAEGQDYTIYVKEYSEQRPERSIRHFTMRDQTGKELFRSFKEELYFMSDGPEPEYVFDVVPYYHILPSVAPNTEMLAIGLNYMDRDDPDVQSSVSELIESEGLNIATSNSEDSTHYIYGYIKMNKDRLSYLPILSSQICMEDVDSLMRELSMIDTVPLDSQYVIQDLALLCALDTSVSYTKRMQLADSIALLENEYMYNYRYAIPIFVIKYIAYNYSFFKEQ